MKTVAYFGRHNFQLEDCIARYSPVANLEMLVKKYSGSMPPPTGVGPVYDKEDLLKIRDEILAVYAPTRTDSCILLVDKEWVDDNDMLSILKYLDKEWQDISVFMFDPDEDNSFCRLSDDKWLEELEVPDVND